tara:strand:- start:1208 stop:1435 length:228 start_codon:yes stop_codon:yes gene_type:complete
MIGFVLAVIVILTSYQVKDNDWKYVGKHECNQVGMVKQTKAKVYAAQVEGYKPYIVFKQKNKDGTYTVSCVLEKP